MKTLLRAGAVLVALLAATSFAQMSFDGLDLGSPKKKAPAKKAPPKKKDDKKPEEGTGTGTGSGTGEIDLPAGGLDLSKPPPEAKKPAETKAAPTMSFDAVDVGGKTGDRQKMDAAISQFKSESFEVAALSFFDMSQDPKYEKMAVESNYWLAKSLYKMGMYDSALQMFAKVLERGPSTKYFKSSLEWLYFIARKTVNESVVLDLIAKYSTYDPPEKFKNEFRYQLARYDFTYAKALDDNDRKGEADQYFSEVKRLSLLIPPNDPFHPRAKYLEGLAYFREGKLETAVESMKAVVKETRLAEGPTTAEQRNLKNLRELAFMQLGRTHYGAKQNRKALFYFSKVERGGPQWLESLFESSWANYRIGESEQALGNLITLSSPFFKDEYFPEALILKAVIYFENCRYREALSIIEDFERIYGPVQEKIDELVQKDMEASQYFTIFEEVRKKNKSGERKNNTDEILERILNLALTDKDLKKTVDSIGEIETEIDSFGAKSDNFKYSGLSKSLIESLKTQRTELIKKAGILAKGRLEFEVGSLKTLRANGLRIKFETTSQEKEFLEKQLGVGGETKLVKDYKYSEAVPDDYFYWPYVGEYWRDELGTYQYTLTKGCLDKSTGSSLRE